MGTAFPILGAPVGLPIAPESMTARVADWGQEACVLMRHEGNAGRLAPLDDVDAILPCPRERLLHDRRKLARRHSDELGVRFHCGGDVDEIELLTVKRFGSVGIGCACAVTLCGGSLLSRSLRILVTPLLVLFTYLPLFNNA